VFDMKSAQAAKYVVGIDLGTTNSVLSYADISDPEWTVKVLAVPQLVAPQTVEPRQSLPSFHLAATESENTGGMFRLPWSEQSEFAVGTMARDLSAEYPERTIGAAKSWLCHSRVDRRSPILPWQAPEHVGKISPVTASQRYLQHLIAAWNQAFPDSPMADQSVVLTVPASFDASARELTREAAAAAGLPEDCLLLEEPQAATYSWLGTVGDRWRKILKVGDRILVCDIGGGTTDLTLVEVGEQDGELILQRIAVGNHLLVGGDNMDLALAHYVAGLFTEKGISLDPWQSVSLWHRCRQAKEALLSESGPEVQTISVPGRSSRLIGGMVTVEVHRHAVAELLTNGFFPKCELNEGPRKSRTSGFRDLGLPYESDTAITRHLAAFIRQHSGDHGISHVLFNGGVFRSAQLKRVMLDQLKSWFPDRPPVEVEGDNDLEDSVARGACCYGLTRIHGGIRIRGGTGRSYYVGIETAGLAIPGAPRPLRALCVVPLGMEEGSELDVPSDPIGLVVGESARFRFFSSGVRPEDVPGTGIDRWSPDEIIETDSLEAVLPGSDDQEDDYVPVRFQTRITELGVFELWCVSLTDDRRWKLEFSVRDES
jgi:hypothetical protein